MNKQAFLAQLYKGLSSLSQKEREERINFYSEMIDDRMEEGLSEEDAVLQIGEVDTIVSQIVADASCGKSADKPKKKYNAWTIALLALGAPVWFSLLASAFAVVLSLYGSLWAVIVSFWSIFIAAMGCAIGGVIISVVYFTLGNPLIGIALLGAALVCAGLSVLFFFACTMVTKTTVKCTKTLATRCKTLLKKENVL